MVTGFLFETHRGLGYLAVVFLLVVAVIAAQRAREAKEFSTGLYVAATISIDVQVLLGLVYYGMERYWEHPSALIAYVHPTLALAALVVGHATLRKARAEPMAVASHRIMGRGLLLAVLLIVGAVAVAVTG